MDDAGVVCFNGSVRYECRNLSFIITLAMRFFVNDSRTFSLRTQAHTEIPEITDLSLIVA